jgi:hypothetical protein
MLWPNAPTDEFVGVWIPRNGKVDALAECSWPIAPADELVGARI